VAVTCLTRAISSAVVQGDFVRDLVMAPTGQARWGQEVVGGLLGEAGVVGGLPEVRRGWREGGEHEKRLLIFFQENLAL
jgi:hypothetical protein